MEATRARKIRMERHAARLAKEAMRYGGNPVAVARALGHARSTASHWGHDRPHRAVLDICNRLIAGSATDPIGLMQAMDDAYELEAIVRAKTDALIHDGIVLLEKESEWDGREDEAALRGPIAHADALDQHRRTTRPLSLNLRELAERGEDLHAIYRARNNGSRR